MGRGVALRRVWVRLLAGLPVSLAALGAAGQDGPISPAAGMMRFPDVSESRVTFVYANDIWVAPKEGGLAQPLASPPGAESFPRFSPDGNTIAFVGNYDGNRDLYTMPVGGGLPERLSHHPAGETLADWSPDGSSLVFLSNGLGGLARQSQLWRVSASGGLPEKLPVPYAGFGSISPDGTWLAYTPHSTDTRTWKRYRGGMATDIWLFNLKDNSAKQITDWEGNDTLPMWAPGDTTKVYYLSDNGPEHRLNIWSYDIETQKREQVTAFKDNDVRWPSMGPGKGGRGEIVFQLGSELMLIDLPSRVSKAITVQIPGGRPKVRVQAEEASANIDGWALSPTAKRVVVEARGDLWSVPAKEGVSRQMTRTDGYAERDPSWSPDGRWIAYFSDEGGEYELWVRPSDALPPEEKKDAKKPDAKGADKADEKSDAKSDEKAEAAKSDDATPEANPEEAKPDGAKPAAKPEPRKLTSLGAGFRFSPRWSPDSKHIAFTDQAGRLMLTVVESGETRELDKDPWMGQPQVSWSHDSAWIAYTRGDDGKSQSGIWIVNIKSGEKTRVISPMFNASSPAFDRAGDFLFYVSANSFSSPVYADIDTTFAYARTEQVLMVPLRKDVKNPWLPESDEERWKKEDAKKDEPKKDDKKDGEKKDAPAGEDDGVSGSWQGSVEGAAPGGAALPVSMSITVDAQGKVTGTIVSAMGSAEISGDYDKATGKFSVTGTVNGQVVTLNGTLKDGVGEGTWSVGEMSGAWKLSRSGKGGAGAEEKKDDAKKDEKKELKIDFEGFEARSMLLPITPGNFGNLAVADGDKLLYVRSGSRGEGVSPGIKVFEYKADEKEEKAVVGGGGFALSADGKKILVGRGGASAAIHDASAGGGKAQTVTASPLRKVTDPRVEWGQLFNDVWRVQRDFFYEPTMHGVDWKKVGEHYRSMLADASSREDVNWIFAEMISELNIGHAYVSAPGDVESAPSVGVGLLGADYTLEKTAAGAAYKIAAIYTGGDWDADARGPLSQPGVDVKVGDYLLAVNGLPVDTAKDPWAAFVGLANQVVSITVNASPVMDGKERNVLVRTIGDEGTLRYRAWIERNRKYVEEKSGGKIGYIYVPNTGVDGQNDLFRQFFGQRDKAALLIDERWNGGGQIPTRFIELLNRPVTNYWARRDGKDWVWPPDSHQGPKAMLVNGLAGSGGDMFPWLFKHNKIGKVFGTRTWGGLVGISGNPGLIDGGYISVPTFGFYESDGTWGVEGHGVDPDVVVIDDPSLLFKGIDPQIDAAVAHLLQEIETNGYRPPQRPASPNRSGMGLPDSDK